MHAPGDGSGRLLSGSAIAVQPVCGVGLKLPWPEEEPTTQNLSALAVAPFAAVAALEAEELTQTAQFGTENLPLPATLSPLPDGLMAITQAGGPTRAAVAYAWRSGAMAPMTLAKYVG